MIMSKCSVYVHVYVSFPREGLSVASRRLNASGREEDEEMRSFVENLLVSEKYRYLRAEMSLKKR